MVTTTAMIVLRIMNLADKVIYYLHYLESILLFVLSNSALILGFSVYIATIEIDIWQIVLFISVRQIELTCDRLAALFVFIVPL